MARVGGDLECRWLFLQIVVGIFLHALWGKLHPCSRGCTYMPLVSMNVATSIYLRECYFMSMLMFWSFYSCGVGPCDQDSFFKDMLRKKFFQVLSLCFHGQLIFYMLTDLSKLHGLRLNSSTIIHGSNFYTDMWNWVAFAKRFIIYPCKLLYSIIYHNNISLQVN